MPAVHAYVTAGSSSCQSDACTARDACLLHGASHGTRSGNAGGICQASRQGLQRPLERGCSEGLPQMTLLQLSQQQLGVCIPVFLPDGIIGLHMHKAPLKALNRTTCVLQSKETHSYTWFHVHPQDKNTSSAHEMCLQVQVATDNVICKRWTSLNYHVWQALHEIMSLSYLHAHHAYSKTQHSTA